jgi:hypothetical protein
MRNDWRARAIVVLGSILAAASCTTTQPESLGTRTASLQIVTRADVNIFNCYELWADDGTGNLQFTEIIECYTALNQIGNPDVANRLIPWQYSLSISIIHKGTINEEIVTSVSGVIGSSIQPGDGIDNFVSLSAYDPTDQPADFKAANFRPDLGLGLVSYLNGKKVSRGSPFWQLPNGFDLGQANILTAAPSFDFEVNPGDTVIVRARKQTVALSPRYIQVTPPTNPPPKITLIGTLAVGGTLVSPTGTTSSTTADGAGISFSFTVQ